MLSLTFFQTLILLVKDNYFLNREFSFTLADDVYVRYQSFKDQTELEEEMKKLKPQKIDIGAVYNFRYLTIIIVIS